MNNMKHLRLFLSLLMSCAVILIWQNAMTSVASAQTITAMRKNTQQSSCLQPPQNVDLMTLSDAQLISYGLPTHAIIDEDPQSWSHTLAHAKHHTCGGQALNQPIYDPLTGSLCTSVGSVCPWAGYILKGPRGTYREAYTEFYVPAISLAPTNAVAGYWVGIGGEGNIAGGSSQVLVQAGIQTNPKNGKQFTETWYEVVGAGTQTGCTIAPKNLPLANGIAIGDDIQIHVVSNSVGYSNQDGFFIFNTTRNDYNSAVYVETTNCLSDSATAEFIVEQPFSDPLPEFNGFTGPNKTGLLANTIPFLNCRGVDSNGANHYFNGSPYLTVQSYTNTSSPVEMASVSGYYNGNDFNVNWVSGGY